MKTLKETQYLAFVIPDENDNIKQPKKTKLVAIINRHHEEIIGEIKWFSRWRQYCFYPYPNTIWNINCLTDVNSVIKDLMNERKPKVISKTIGVIANSMKDFQDWRKQYHPEGIINDTIRKFVHNGNTYVCLSNVFHACGCTFDEVTETSKAKDNQFYYRIVECAKPALKSSGIWLGKQLSS